MGFIENMKEAVKFAQQLGNVEMTQSLISAQQDALDLMTENQKIRGEIAELREALEKEQQLEYHHGCYWLRTSPETLDGPFSAISWGDGKKLLRMKRWERNTYNHVEKVNFHSPVNDKEIELVPVSFLRANNVAALDEHEEMERERSS